MKNLSRYKGLYFAITWLVSKYKNETIFCAVSAQTQNKPCKSIFMAIFSEPYFMAFLYIAKIRKISNKRNVFEIRKIR